MRFAYSCARFLLAVLEVRSCCELVLCVILGAVSCAAVAHISTIFKLQEISESSERCGLLWLVLALIGGCFALRWIWLAGLLINWFGLLLL